MATVTKNNARTMRKHQGITPYGNLSAIRVPQVCDSTGALDDSDDATVVAIGDVLRLGPYLPAGMELHDCIGRISTAMKAATTVKVGFQYVDGVDDTDVPEDDDYFFPAGQATSSTGLIRSDAVTAPVILPKDAYLIVTTAGAAQDGASRIDWIVSGEMKGVE